MAPDVQEVSDFGRLFALKAQDGIDRVSVHGTFNNHEEQALATYLLVKLLAEAIVLLAAIAGKDGVL
jgi:hypothetical protein